jgi:hypothetical protein
MDLKVVFGSHGSTFGFRAPVAYQVETTPIANDGGVLDVPNVFIAMDAGSTSSTYTAAVAKIPDWALHIS